MGKTIDLTQPLSSEDRAWLVERGKIGDLRVADEIAAAAAESEAASEAQDDDDEVVDSEEYGEWTKAQLQYELTERNLPTSGTKAELVTRLEEDDAAATE